MKALITGMSGFIGTHLRKRLLELGYEVIGVPRDYLFEPVALKYFIKYHNPNTFYHLAAYGNHYDQNDSELILKTNVIGTCNLVCALKELKGKTVLFNFSTSSVNLPIDTPYSNSKKISEAIINEYTPSTNIRPYSVYGPGEAPFRFIPKIIRILYYGFAEDLITIDENATHDWIFIDSFIDFIIGVDIPYLRYYEIGTGIKTTNKEVVNILEEISNEKLHYVPGKLRNYDNDNWVAKEGVPHISLKEGLKKTYDYYVEQFEKKYN